MYVQEGADLQRSEQTPKSVQKFGRQWRLSHCRRHGLPVCSHLCVLQEIWTNKYSWTCATPRQDPEVERTNIYDKATWNTLYTKAEKLIGTSEDVLKDSVRQRLVLETLRNEFPDRKVKPLPLAAKKVEHKNLITWSSSATVLGNLKSNANFTILDQHICKKLNTTKGGKNNSKVKITSAEVTDLAAPGGKDKKTITAKQFVVCGGPILTPQLLYSSGFRPEEKINNAVDPLLRLPALVWPLAFFLSILPLTAYSRVIT